MGAPEITGADWQALARAYGEVQAEVMVYRRTCEEQAAEIATLRAQLAACADEIHTAPSGRQEGS